MEKSPILKCNQCEFVFDGGNNRRSHAKRDQRGVLGSGRGSCAIIDSGEKPIFECNQCECVFSDVSMLESHK